MLTLFLAIGATELTRLSSFELAVRARKPLGHLKFTLVHDVYTASWLTFIIDSLTASEFHGVEIQ